MAGESRVEYRVLYLKAYALAGSLDAARRTAAELREGGTSVWGIQRRTITETPWEDVVDAKG